MQWKIKRSLVWLLIAALLLSTLQVGVLTVEAEVTNGDIPNGEYEVDFNYLEDGKNSVSTANQYMKISGQKGKLIVDNGQITSQHEMLKAEYAHFEYLGIRPVNLPRAIILHNAVTRLEEVSGHEGYQIISVVLKAGDDSYVVASYTIENPAITPAAIDQYKVTLFRDYQGAEQKRYVAHQPLSLYVLDTNQPTSELSVYAEEVSPSVTTVIQKNN